VTVSLVGSVNAKEARKGHPIFIVDINTEPHLKKTVSIFDTARKAHQDTQLKVLKIALKSEDAYSHPGLVRLGRVTERKGLVA